MNRLTKRCGRIVLNALTAISLILALATAAAWVRSGFVWDIFDRVRSDGEYVSIQLSRGEIHWWTRGQGYVSPFAIEQDKGPGPDMPDPLEWRHRTEPPHFVFDPWTNNRFLPYGWAPYRMADPVPGAWGVTFRLWCPLLVFGAFPLFRIVRRLRKSCTRPGHCPACGYDIRANPSRCSECGKEIERSENTTTIEGDSASPASNPSP